MTILIKINIIKNKRKEVFFGESLAFKSNLSLIIVYEFI